MKNIRIHVSFKIKLQTWLILSSAVAGCVSISAFALLVCVSVGITSSAVEINICAIIVGIKKYKSIIKKKKKSMIN